MIRLAGPQDEPHILASMRRTPCLGARMEVDWTLKQRNSRLPFRFYVDDGGMVLQLTPGGALLCGMPQNSEETTLFLQFSGTERFTSSGWVPQGYRATGHLLMARAPICPPGKAPSAPFPNSAHTPAGFDAAPRAEDILQVLESSDGRIQPELLREGFYSDICMRRNHALAEIYGIRKGGSLLCTAGIYALTQTQAYLACVETQREARGRGYASLLVSLLCNRFGDRTITLMCKPDLDPYYRRLGFTPIPGQVVLALPPPHVIPTGAGVFADRRKDATCCITGGPAGASDEKSFP